MKVKRFTVVSTDIKHHKLKIIAAKRNLRGVSALINTLINNLLKSENKK